VWSNWSRNVKISARLIQPKLVEELNWLVDNCEFGLVGRGYSFNKEVYGEAPPVIVDLSRIERTLSIEENLSEITVGPSVTLRDVAVETSKFGLQLNNYPSRLDFSVIGSIATGSHGSGENACLSTMVKAFTLLEFKSGEIIELKRGSPQFTRSLILPFRTGIITSLTLQVSKSASYSRLAFGGLSSRDIPSLILMLADQKLMFSVYLNLTDSERNSCIITSFASDIENKSMRIMNEFPGFFVGSLKSRGLRVERNENYSEIGSSHSLIPHSTQKLPLVGEELQSEYFFRVEDFQFVYFAIFEGLPDGIVRVIRSIELRYLEKSDCLFSPSYGVDVIGIHFTWRNDPPYIVSCLEKLEKVLLDSLKTRGEFMRVHWGKLFSGPISDWFGTFDVEGKVT
jgi:xylitol oxidase